MAKRLRNKTQRDDLDSYEGDEQPAQPARRVKPKRATSRLRWFGTRLIAMLVVLLILVGLTPTLLVSTGLWKTALNYAAPQLKGKLEVGSLSLGWLSPVVLKNITLKDDAGQPLAEIASIQGNKSLLSLATNSSHLGKFTITGVHAILELRPHGSNLEDFAAQLSPADSKTPPSSSSMKLAVEVDLVGSSVDVIDSASGKAWKLDDVTANALWNTAPGQARSAKLAAKLATVSTATQPTANFATNISGDIGADFSWQPTATGMGSGTVQTNLNNVPTELAEPLLRRFAGDFQTGGNLTADLLYEWKDDLAQQHLTIKNIQSAGLSLASTQYLPGDQVQLAIQTLHGEIDISPAGLKINDLKLDSDLAQLSGHGSANLANLSSAGIAGALQSTDEADQLALRGQVNLVRLAQQLPHTLHLRPGMQLTTGTLQVALESGLVLNKRRWMGSLKTDRIEANIQDPSEARPRRIVWDQPVAVSAMVSQDGGSLKLDELKCESSFLTAEGQGTLRNGRITASGSLDKLAEELGQFLSLGDTRLAGNLSTNLNWQTEGSRLTGEGKVRVQNFELQGGGLRPWKEHDLELVLTASGPLSEVGITTLESAGIELRAGSDELDVNLREPLLLQGSATAANVNYGMKGELANWMSRVQAWMPLPGWQIAGGIDASGSGIFSTQAAVIEPSKIVLRKFQALSPSLAVQEPQVVLEFSGRWSQAEQTLDSPSMTFACSSLAARADQIKLVLAPGQVGFTGTVDYRGDLGRLSNWVGAPNTPRTQRLGGGMQGHLEADWQAGMIHANWTSDLENLALETLAVPGSKPGVAQVSATLRPATWQTAWVEPKVELGGEGTYNPAKDQLQLKSASIGAAAIQLMAAGTIDQLLTTAQTNLQGEVAYDMADVTTKLRPMLGDSLAITGQERRKFSLQGPLLAAKVTSTDPRQPAAGGLISNDLAGEASFGWESAQFVGLVAGGANLDAKLERGLVSIQPFSLPVAEGKLNAAPQLYLNEPNMPLVLGAGPLVENMRISPELCQTWLKYVAPLLADATHAEGKFSVSLTGATLPLLQPSLADVEGKLTIHEAKIGPGPLADQYISLANQLKALMEKKPLDALGSIAGRFAGGAETAPADGSDPSGSAPGGKTWLDLPEQNIDVRVVDGRVHHQGLRMNVKDVVITTEGSVGMDQTVELVASVPILDKWVEKDPYLASLKGQSIKIPIRGPLSAPRLDMRAMQEFSRTILTSAAKGAVNNQINKGLGKGSELLQGKMKAGEGLLEQKLKDGENKVQEELGKGLQKLFGR